MTKTCADPNCTNEIQQWQTYCPQHYAEMMQKQQQAEMPKQPDAPKVVKTEEVKVLPLPQLEERERLIVKQTCLKSAVELMKSFDNEAKEFDQLMQEVETLTVYFYKTVVSRNENLTGDEK